MADDPDFPDHKANYREFLNEQSHFHQPIPIRDPSIQRKIHNAYRLQFLKDVVLARAIDDSTFNVINSCILFNQIDIITHIQQDPTFLREVVSLYVDQDMLSGGGRKTAPSPSPQRIMNIQHNQPPDQRSLYYGRFFDARASEEKVLKLGGRDLEALVFEEFLIEEVDISRWSLGCRLALE